MLQLGLLVVFAIGIYLYVVHPLGQWPAKQACVVIIRSVIALSLDNLMAFYEMFMNVQVFQHNFFNDGCFF